MSAPLIIKPQSQKQIDVLSCSADILISGGQAGGGKSYGLLMEGARNMNIKGANALIFRRTTPQIKQNGGLWDTSYNVYPYLGAKPNVSNLLWRWPHTGYYVRMTHLEYEGDVFDWDGAQIPVLLFDELRHFTEIQFFYMLSRNRSVSKILPYCRATTNPEPVGWLRDMVDWWIGADGFAIEERCGVIRWFVRLEDKLHWADTKEELIETFVGSGFTSDQVKPKSFTFINSSLKDNPTLMREDPNYMSNILAQHKVERERLLGNWNSKAQAGDFFTKDMFEEIGPLDLPSTRKITRFWDRAATEKGEGKDPDGTCGIKQSRDTEGMFFVEDMSGLHFKKPAGVERTIMNTAKQDGKRVAVGLSEDPASAGKFEAAYYTRRLAGWEVYTTPESKMGKKINSTFTAKEVRAAPVSSQATAGNYKVVKGPWNEDFYKYTGYFPIGRYKDPVDSLSGGFHFLSNVVVYDRFKRPDVTVEAETDITLDDDKWW